MLRLRGHATKIATTGAEALKTLSCQNFDMVIIDISLSDMDGIDLFSKITAIRASVIIVTISAATTPELTAELNRMGIKHHLAVPFQMADLYRIIDLPR
jgi:DNA-binding NtrC family response regulator